MEELKPEVEGHGNAGEDEEEDKEDPADAVDTEHLSVTKTQNFFANAQVKSEYFMDLNPLEKALKEHNIEGKRKMLKQILEQPKLTVKRRQEIER